MADTWFTSDFHFGHFNIIRYCNASLRTQDVFVSERIKESHSGVEQIETLKNIRQETQFHQFGQVGF